MGEPIIVNSRQEALKARGFNNEEELQKFLEKRGEEWNEMHKFYVENRQNFLRDYNGKYILIVGKKVVFSGDTDESSIEYVLKNVLYGTTHFHVRVGHENGSIHHRVLPLQTIPNFVPDPNK